MVDDLKKQENSAEDVISSIKEAAESQSQDSIDDILDLTETEMVSNTEQPAEELIDIKSFDESGELTKATDDSALAAKAKNGDDAAIEAFSKTLKETEESSQDDVDSMLDSIKVEEPLQENSNELSSKADMLENASKTYAEKTFDSSDDEGEDENQYAEPKEATLEDIAAAMSSVAPELNQQQAEKIKKDLENKVTEKVALKAVPGVSGLQVGFPIEVLAEALRPMVSDWVEENLPSIVEKLVKEELSKLADK